MGEIVLPLQASPTYLLTAFTIVLSVVFFDILLSQSWIYKFRVVPSTIHRCVKFIHTNKVIIVDGVPYESPLSTLDLCTSLKTLAPILPPILVSPPILVLLPLQIQP